MPNLRSVVTQVHRNFSSSPPPTSAATAPRLFSSPAVTKSRFLSSPRLFSSSPPAVTAPRLFSSLAVTESRFLSSPRLFSSSPPPTPAVTAPRLFSYGASRFFSSKSLTDKPSLLLLPSTTKPPLLLLPGTTKPPSFPNLKNSFTTLFAVRIEKFITRFPLFGSFLTRLFNLSIRIDRLINPSLTPYPASMKDGIKAASDYLANKLYHFGVYLGKVVMKYLFGLSFLSTVLALVGLADAADDVEAFYNSWMSKLRAALGMSKSESSLLKERVENVEKVTSEGKSESEKILGRVVSVESQVSKITGHLQSPVSLLKHLFGWN